MSRFRTFAVGVAAAVVVVLAAVSPASAHDDLLSSTPSAGQRLDAPMSSVALEFSADVMDIGALVMIADASDGEWAAGEAEITGNTVTVPVVEGMPAGGYEVRWRVVSSDGHPISGVIPFTVGDGEPLVREAASGSEDTVESTGADTAEPQNAQETGDIVRIVLIGVGGAAIAVALLAGIHFLRRRTAGTGGSGD